MSNSTQDSGIDVAQMDSEVELGIITSYLTTAAIAWICFEWVISFDQEIKQIWARKWTLSTWIFAGSRYGTIIPAVMLLVAPTPNYSSCLAQLYLLDAFELLQFLALALFTGLRTYALCSRKILVFLVVFGLSATPFVVNLLEIVKSTTVFSASDATCEQDIPWNTGILGVGVSVATRVPVIIADIIALIITWRKAIGNAKGASRMDVRAPLSRVLIEDGTILFLGLLMTNIFQVLEDNIPFLQVVHAQSEAGRK